MFYMSGGYEFQSRGEKGLKALLLILMRQVEGSTRCPLCQTNQWLLEISIYLINI